MRRLSLCLLALIPAAALAAGPTFLDPSLATPPVAKQKLHDRTIHGDTFADAYFWLREKGTPDVMSYLEAENAYTAAVTKPLEPLREKLYQEMLGRIKQTDLSVPVRRGQFYYYSRSVEGKQYPIQCRKKGSPDGPEEVLLDGNEMAKGHAFFSIGQQNVSDDANLLAFATDTTGFREYQLFVKDLRTGQVLPEHVTRVSSCAWAADNKALFYVRQDDAKRPHKLFRHVLGQPTDKDELIYEEKDELFRLGVGRTRDKKYLLASVSSSDSAETRYLAADQPQGEWKMILPRENGHRYSVEHRDGLFYIRTNKGATNNRLVTTPVADPSPAHWTDFIAHRPDVLLEGEALFKDHMVYQERADGLPQICVYDFATKQTHRLSFPEPVYGASLDANPEYDSTTFRYRYHSMVTPDSVYEYDLTTRATKLLKQTEVLGGYDPARYQSERVWATASDGTKIPISLVYRKGVARDGTAPLYLTGYGAYGSSAQVNFAPARLSLLDRGVVFAQAHIRGGKDLGQAWHDQGKMMNKRNTFTDFIACADHLVAQKFAARDRMAIQGGSAGGLLIGAVVNFRPDLCKAAVLQVPFVDVINTMLDPSLPLTVQEFLEWGNPMVKEQYDYMKTYCPYTNLSAKSYPAMLVTTSLNDSQVMYWEPAKYVARLRSLKTDKNPLVFKCNMAGGHGGSSGRYDALRDQAFVFAFVLDQIGARQ